MPSTLTSTRSFLFAYRLSIREVGRAPYVCGRSPQTAKPAEKVEPLGKGVFILAVHYRQLLPNRLCANQWPVARSGEQEGIDLKACQRRVPSCSDRLVR